MIVDKKSNKVISGNNTSIIAKPEVPEQEPVEVPVQVESNGPMDVLSAMKEILSSAGSGFRC